MSHDEVGPGAADGQSMERVAAELRTPVPVRAEWRAGLLRGVAMLPPPGPVVDSSRSVRHWRFRPVAAIAAGLACALVGAGVTALVLQRPLRRGTSDPLTSLTSTMPLPGESVAEGRSTVRFVFVAPYASRVALVGDFNAWNPAAMPMRRSTDGRAWLLDVPLAPGRHVYSFIVDGDLAPDPAAPRAGDDDFGVPSSVVLVSAGGPKS
jgi:hypothetical protein